MDECEKAREIVESRLDELSDKINVKKRKVEELEIAVMEAENVYKKLQSDLAEEKEEFEEKTANELKEHKLWSTLNEIMSMSFNTYFIILSHKCFGKGNQKLLRWLQGKKLARAPRYEGEEVDIDIKIPQEIRARLNSNYRFMECSITLYIDIDRTSHNKHNDTTYSVESYGNLDVENIDGTSSTRVRKEYYKLYDDIHGDWIVDALKNDEYLSRELDCDGYGTSVDVEAIAIYHFL